MDFFDQANGDGKLVQASQSVVHRGDVIHHFIHVLRGFGREDMRLGGEEVLQGALRAFDLAGKDGLLAHIHEDEEVGMRKNLNGATEPPQGAVCFGK